MTGKNWPIADQRVSNNDPRKHCGTHFDFISVFVSKVANVWLKGLIQNPLSLNQTNIVENILALLLAYLTAK